MSRTATLGTATSCTERPRSPRMGTPSTTGSRPFTCTRSASSLSRLILEGIHLQKFDDPENLRLYAEDLLDVADKLDEMNGYTKSADAEV